MELPADVLVIIREYSRPLMKYVNEFYSACRDIKTIMPVSYVLIQFIKEKLYTNQAKKVMD
jgi:hypothetical protein